MEKSSNYGNDRSGDLTARIFNIQPMSTEDGPGIRTSVFFKGCPLKCAWCQNPEGLTMDVHLLHEPLRCIGCGTCMENCPNGAIKTGEKGLWFDLNCQKCMACVNGCPAMAIRSVGEDITLSELKEKLLQDLPFYKNSDGGVTFTGGECMLQPEFLQAIISEMNKEGVHTCIDTSGQIKEAVFQKVAPQVSLVLFDLKLIEEEKHRLYTGVSNRTILNNARWLGSAGVPVWIRVAIIPGYTDDHANIEGIARFVRENMLPAVERIDMLGYNDLCANDYEKMQMGYSLSGTPRVKESEMIELQNIMKSSGVEHITFSNYRKGE